MPVIDVEFARTRGQSEREGFLYVDMHPMLANRVLRWQHALMSADQQVPEWTSIARWQVVRALIALGYQLPEQPVRYTTRCRDIDASGAFRTRLALVPSVAAACFEEARYRECDLREVVNACLASLPDEPPTLPPRMERAELQRLYLEQKNARAREVRRARANGEELALKKAGRLSQLERDAAAVESMLQAVVPVRQDVYVERFLLLCKEREARDRWLLKGGKGKPPASTVDDHLGRKRGSFNADKVAASKSYHEWRISEGPKKGGKRGGTKSSAAQRAQRERLGNTWVL
jgi:hypothetical protein